MRAVVLALRSKRICSSTISIGRTGLTAVLVCIAVLFLALAGSDGDVACQRDRRVFFTYEHIRIYLDTQMKCAAVTTVVVPVCSTHSVIDTQGFLHRRTQPR